MLHTVLTTLSYYIHHAYHLALQAKILTLKQHVYDDLNTRVSNQLWLKLEHGLRSGVGKYVLLDFSLGKKAHTCMCLNPSGDHCKAPLACVQKLL